MFFSEALEITRNGENLKTSVYTFNGLFLERCWQWITPLFLSSGPLVALLATARRKGDSSEQFFEWQRRRGEKVANAAVTGVKRQILPSIFKFRVRTLADDADGSRTSFLWLWSSTVITFFRFEDARVQRERESRKAFFASFVASSPKNLFSARHPWRMWM